MNLRFCTVIMFVLLYPLTIGAQEDRQSPGELISNYYQQGFSPFAKGNWYTGISFSVKDETFENRFDFLGLDRAVSGTESEFEIDLGLGYLFSDYFMAGWISNWSDQMRQPVG